MAVFARSLSKRVAAGNWLGSLLSEALFGVPGSVLSHTILTRTKACTWPLENQGMWHKRLNSKEMIPPSPLLHLTVHRGLYNYGVCVLDSPKVKISFQ